MSAACLQNASLHTLNTLGLRAEAPFLLHLESIAQLATWRDTFRELDLPFGVLGGGSNLVLSERIQKIVILNKLKGRRVLREDEAAFYVAAAGGENWHSFVEWTLAQGWGGLENLALIPGTVGAAPVQNIGAYGVEVKDRIDHLTATHLYTGEQRVFSASDCQFTYRDSVFKQAEAEQWLITEVVFRLAKNHQPQVAYGDIERELATLGLGVTPSTVAQAVIQVRQRKLPDPAVIGNAGSYFKNPIVAVDLQQSLLTQYPQLVSYALPDGQFKLAAGWLIERAGWKGRDLGPVGMYEKQALVLVNHGGASASDVLALEAAVQHDVMAKFGVALEAEPIKW